jgi:hypothetical protein
MFNPNVVADKDRRDDDVSGVDHVDVTLEGYLYTHTCT